jgi:hypothetical protein
MSPMQVAIVSSLFVAAVATIADWVWASQLLPHRMWYGVVHGAGLCGAMGLAVGVPARRPLTGLAGGLIAGVMAAASFYLFAPLLRYAAMFLSWCLLWVLFAFLDGPILRDRPRPEALVRGSVAALCSGAAFYGVSGMWTGWNPATINYAEHFGRWAVAFLPGFVALRWQQGARR